jgi:DNA-binding NarL/FixJ family response regulator
VLVAEGANARPLVRVAPVRPLRILVVDDHEVLRNGLRWLLSRVPWVERCAGAKSAEEALLLARSIAFDVALVDVDLGTECGLQTCERLSALIEHTALLTSRWDLVGMRTARQAGARGVIAKDRPARALLEAVHALAAGGACEPIPTAPDEVRFVPREREILRLVGSGLTNAEIGASLYLAPGTIKHHMLGLYDKLGAPNRAAAVHAARRLGVLADHRADHVVEGAPAGADVSVLVADPDDVRRAGLLLALHGRGWVTACSGARDTEDALAVARRMAPDVALVAGTDLSRVLSASGVRTLLVRDDEADSPAELREAGASGAVRQWWTSERLADAVARECRPAHPREAGGSSVATSADPKAAGPGGGSPPVVVSPREREVLSAFATGATNPAIAADLGLSPNTVKQHASSIFRKLGVRNRAEAVRRANDLGLLAA